MCDRTGSGKLLAMLTERKAPGPDRISSEFINYATHQFKASLVNAFNKFLGLETVPKCFQKSIIFPIRIFDSRQHFQSYKSRSYIDSGKKLYAFFVDFRATFDSIDRRTLTLNDIFMF